MIARTLGRQVAQSFVLALPAGAALVAGLQALRVSPIAAAARADAGEWATAFGTTVVLAAEAIAPAAFGVATVLVVLRWHADGELLAARAAGLSVLRLARGPLVAAAFAALLVAGISAWLAPRAAGRLVATWGALAPRAVAGAVRPGAMVELAPGVLVYAERRGRDGALQNVVVADRDADAVLAARAARLRIVPGDTPSLVLEARQGTLRRGATRGHFARLSMPLDVAAEVETRRGAIGDLGGPSRTIWSTLSFALAAAAMVLAALLFAAHPGRLALCVGVLVAARELAGRIGPAARLAEPLASALPAIAIGLPCAALLSFAARRAAW